MDLVCSKMIKSWWRCKFNFLSLRVSNRLLCSHSTSTTSPPSSSSSSSSSSANYDHKPHALYQKIYVADSRVPVSQILDQWVSEGNQLRPPDLHALITQLRYFRRFSHALQVSVWMNEKYTSSWSVSDIANQLELTSRVYGHKQAEKFFENLPENLRHPVVYRTLLTGYADARDLKKAEGLMQKMKELGIAKVTDPYNSMLKMYYRLEMYDKFELVIQEMEEKGLSWDTFTYRILLTAYSTSGNVKKMETMLVKMEADPENSMKYSDYLIAANGYLKGGVVDRSLVMLRRAEHLASGKEKMHAYRCLLTLYAQAKANFEVYRLWDLYKRSCNVYKLYNSGLLCMVSALVILDDLEGAEMIIDEWIEGLSADRKLDSRTINPLIRAYCKKGDFERIQAIIDKLKERSGQEPRRSTWEILSTGYRKHNQMEDAVKTMKKAIVADNTAWKLTKATVIHCLEYLSLKGNAEELQEFMSLLENHGYDAEKLLSDHAQNSQRHSNLNGQVEEDDSELLDVTIKKQS